MGFEYEVIEWLDAVMDLPDESFVDVVKLTKEGPKFAVMDYGDVFQALNKQTVIKAPVEWINKGYSAGYLNEFGEAVLFKYI